MRLGRPVLGILTYMIGITAIPYFSTLISLIFLFLSGLVWVAILDRKGRSASEISIFISLYLVSPIYIFQLNFINQSIIIGLGFLLTTFAVYNLLLAFENQYKTSFKYLSLSAIFLFLSLGIYQSFLVLFLEGGIFILLLSSNDSRIYTFKKLACRFLFICIVTLIALSLYTIACKICYIFVGKSEYLNNFYGGWGKESFSDVITHLTEFFTNLVLSPFCYIYIMTIILFLISLRKIKLITALLLPMALLVPFTLPIALGSPMPLRILFSLPLAIAIINMIIFKINARKTLVIIITATSLIIGFKQICQLTYSQNMAQKYNEQTLSNIYNSLFTKYGQKLYDTPVVLIASHQANDSQYIKQAYAQPFYFDTELDLFSGIFPDKMWQTSSLNHRAYYFMRWQGLFYKQPTDTQIKNADGLGSSMKVFPDESSTLKKDGVIFVKVSE